MAERPEAQQNWQLRQYDSFGPQFRIDTGNPELGLSGDIAYNLYGIGSDNNTSSVGMHGSGLYHIYNDQCIEIIGGERLESGSLCVNIVGSKGDVSITAMSNGDVRIKGQNIIIDSTKNVEINAGGDFRVKASNSVNMSSNTCYIKAPYGKIRVREVGWMGSVFKGTAVSENVWGA